MQQRNAVTQGISAMKMNLRILRAISQQGIHKQALGYRRLISFGVDPTPMARVGVYECAMFLLEESLMPDACVMDGYDRRFGEVRSNQLEGS